MNNFFQKRFKPIKKSTRLPNDPGFGKASVLKLKYFFAQASSGFYLPAYEILPSFVSLLFRDPAFKDNAKEKKERLKFLKKKKNYKAKRLLRKLPLRGQRTHTNAKTRKKLNVT